MRKIILILLFFILIIGGYFIYGNKTKKEAFILASQCKKSASTPQSGVFGINFSPYFPWDADPKNFVYLDELGIKWVRAAIFWDVIEKENQNFSWGFYDRLVEEMQKRNINILAGLNNIPSFYLTDWDSVYSNMNNFAKEIVNRYKPGGVLDKQNNWGGYGIKYWEIMNEPNLPLIGWPSRFTNEKKYVKLLASANIGIREADPNAVILNGGLASSGKPMDEFLQKIYDYGGKNCFDILALHPYLPINEVPGIISKMKQITINNNDIKPIWLSEIGYATEGTYKSVDEKTQAEYLKSIYQKESGFAEGIFWYNFRDFNPFETVNENFGILKNDFTKKQSFDILKNLLNKSYR